MGNDGVCGSFVPQEGKYGVRVIPLSFPSFTEHEITDVAFTKAVPSACLRGLNAFAEGL